MKVARWLRRRLAVASPLVIVIACWRSTDPVEPAAARRPAPVGGGAPSDATPEVPITAAAPPVKAVPVTAVPADAAAPGITGGVPTRRKPATAQPRSTMTTPSGAVIAHVIGTTIQGSTTLLTVGAGSNYGIARTWSCELIDEDEQSPPDGGCVIIRVDKAVTMVKAKLTFDQIRVHRRARLTPPP
ncbi:MAG TPA: hypothetical protein VGD37_08730 [Kofleriaceae bacterium]|jgi:hypothetical protein